MSFNYNLRYPISRRRVLSYGALPFLSVLPSTSFSAPWVTHNLYSVATPGGIFELPNSTDVLGIYDCATLNNLANAYKAACKNLTSDQVLEIQANLTKITQVEIRKLKSKVKATDVKQLFEYVSVVEGIFLAILGGCTIALLAAGLPVAAGVAATTAFVYGFAVAPTIDVVRSSIKTDETGEIMFSWGYKKTAALAIRSAADAAQEAGKQALKSLIVFAAALRNLFNGITQARDGLITAEQLEEVVKQTTAAVMTLETEFKPVLSSPEAVRDMVCSAADETAKALEIYTSLYSENNCRPALLNLHHLQIHHGPIIRPGFILP